MAVASVAAVVDAAVEFEACAFVVASSFLAAAAGVGPDEVAGFDFFFLFLVAVEAAGGADAVLESVGSED